MNEPVLIDATTLSRLDPAGLLQVDCRFDLADPVRGCREYLQGHLPGAVYASLDDDLSDLGKKATGLGRHPLPDAADFSRTLARWGWTPQTEVIAYDTAGGAMAARLWWMIRAIGGKARVLDGGLAAWEQAGLALEKGPVERAATSVQREFDASLMLDTAQLRMALEQGEVVLVDARAAARFRGDVEPLDRVGGHVPGACNRPYADNLDGNARFRTPEALRAEFEQILGERDTHQSVHMCGSGVTACHNLLAMAHAGLHGARLYPASWSGWSSDPDRPVAIGS
jgi:thiosulfate/3-mercaptopyruvate sulfurtransferase